ncbi:MAG TPA: hypothetical protein VGZ52_02220 [Acidimicrobiales bacterium]|jgi:hypothetical protein|nr:hypothetical protein [Acidimicrobiales bacterium]
MATDPALDLVLTPLNGEARSVDDWVTLFPLALVVLDPFTYESAWLLEEAGRILTSFTAADVRVGWLVTASAPEARSFLGPWAESLLTFSDPDRAAVKGLGLSTLPAFVVIDMAAKVESVAEGWDPAAWRAAVGRLAAILDWSHPAIPGPGAPGPYAGSPALG